MITVLRSLLVIAVLGAGATLLTPEATQANDGYWNNYWRWYDNDYRSHYYRNYRNYGHRDDPYYRNRYYNTPNTYGYYGDRYPNSLNDRNRFYDRDFYRGRRNSVDINGFRFEWR